MAQTGSINDPNLERGSVAVQDAERAVARSDAKFETAMGHLADKVEISSRRVWRTVDRVKRLKMRLQRFQSLLRMRALAFRKSSRQTANRAVQMTQEFSMRARRRPGLVWSVVSGVVASFVAFRLYQSRQKLKTQHMRGRTVRRKVSSPVS